MLIYTFSKYFKMTHYKQKLHWNMQGNISERRLYGTDKSITVLLTVTLDGLERSRGPLYRPGPRRVVVATWTCQLQHHWESESLDNEVCVIREVPTLSQPRIKPWEVPLNISQRHALAGQLTGSMIPYAKSLWVPSPVRVGPGGDWLMLLSHMMSLSLCLSLFLYSFSKINRNIS